MTGLRDREARLVQYLRDAPPGGSPDLAKDPVGKWMLRVDEQPWPSDEIANDEVQGLLAFAGTTDGPLTGATTFSWTLDLKAVDRKALMHVLDVLTARFDLYSVQYDLPPVLYADGRYTAQATLYG